MSVEFKVKPTLDALKKRHDAALAALKKTEVAMRKVSIMLDQWVQRNFKGEGSLVGGWAPFVHGGRVTRARGGPAIVDTSAKLLQDTGRLRSSYVPFSSRNNAGIGSDLPYAENHNEGLGPLPARRMVPEEPEVLTKIEEILEQHGKTWKDIYDKPL